MFISDDCSRKSGVVCRETLERFLPVMKIFNSGILWVYFITSSKSNKVVILYNDDLKHFSMLNPRHVFGRSFACWV
jgi:hypothetical protein